MGPCCCMNTCRAERPAPHQSSLHLNKALGSKGVAAPPGTQGSGPPDCGSLCHMQIGHIPLTWADAAFGRGSASPDLHCELEDEVLSCPGKGHLLLCVLLPLSAAQQELTGSPHASSSPATQAGDVQAQLPPPPTLDAEEIVVGHPVAAVRGLCWRLQAQQSCRDMGAPCQRCNCASPAAEMNCFCESRVFDYLLLVHQITSASA